MASLSYIIGTDIVELRKEFSKENDYIAVQAMHSFEDKVDGFSKDHEPVPKYLARLLAYCEFRRSRPEDDNEAFAWDLAIDLVNEYIAKTNGN